jgi:D-alanyl-D-alanine carboxypeptidase (penicillin-binding protein 5/6)
MRQSRRGRLPLRRREGRTARLGTRTSLFQGDGFVAQGRDVARAAAFPVHARLRLLSLLALAGLATLLPLLAACSPNDAPTVARATTTATRPAATHTPAPASPTATSVPTVSPTPDPETETDVPGIGLPPAISAPYALLMNSDSGAVYFAAGADTPVPMASTTKIMTAYVALTFGQLDQPITVGPDAASFDPTFASLAGLRDGETLTLRELLYALLLPSGDDAAVAIADGVAGSQQHFVALMNVEAVVLGLSDTHYADVHGLDTADHFTTARDLARLTRFALRLPTFARIVATNTYTLAPTTRHHGYFWSSTNELLGARPYAGATGVKTGFTGNAGECLVFTAQRANTHLLGVLLDEPSDDARFSDAATLLDWGFARARLSAPTIHRQPGAAHP